MVAKRIPNPQDEVRFLSILPGVHERLRRSRSADRACAEGGAPALQAGFLGALPSRSTETSIAAELRRGALAHVARWPCTSLVSRRVRFDSERGLR